MTKKDRMLARAALLEGMMTAIYATQHEGNDVGSDMEAMVDAAVASLEASGFAIVRKRQ